MISRSALGAGQAGPSSGICAHLPKPDPRADDAADLVAKIATKPEITRVAMLARDASLGVRQPQRLFA